MKRETVEFNGKNYHRWPESEHKHLRVYFWCHDKNKEPPRSLHTDMWRAEHGEIPEGHVIHHKDENPLNNTLENFECMPLSEHQALHLRERNDCDSHRAHLEKIRPMTKAWHKSPEGRAWHKEHAKKNGFGSRTYGERNCKQCGAQFTAKSIRAALCSPICRSRWGEAKKREKRDQSRS